MDASIEGTLNYMNRHPNSKMHFNYKEQEMTNEQVRKVLEYALSKGYKSVYEISNTEIDEVLKTIECVILRHPK